MVEFYSEKSIHGFSAINSIALIFQINSACLVMMEVRMANANSFIPPQVAKNFPLTVDVKIYIDVYGTWDAFNSCHFYHLSPMSTPINQSKSSYKLLNWRTPTNQQETTILWHLESTISLADRNSAEGLSLSGLLDFVGF